MCVRIEAYPKNSLKGRGLGQRGNNLSEAGEKLITYRKGAKLNSLNVSTITMLF